MFCILHYKDRNRCIRQQVEGICSTVEFTVGGGRTTLYGVLRKISAGQAIRPVWS